MSNGELLEEMQGCDSHHLKGSEAFTLRGNDTGLTVLEFWRWYYSDLLDNKARVAEYLLLKALGFSGANDSRFWSPHNVIYKGSRIEIRTAAYMKSSNDDEPSDKHIRHIDIRAKDCQAYLFCLLPGKTKETADPLILDNWEFYIIPAWYLELECGKNITITMSKVRRLVKLSRYGSIKEEIDKVILEMSPQM